jgi:hypothetical protein
MGHQSEPARLFRIVQTNPPTQDDFVSNPRRGKPVRHVTPQTQRLIDGLSVFDSEEMTRSVARSFPKIGTFIAELHVRSTGTLRWERTTRTPGHYTLWGDPDECLNSVTRVTSV